MAQSTIVLAHGILGFGELFDIPLPVEYFNGVVTKVSELRDGHEHLPDWPVDHAGEVGWSFEPDLPILKQLGPHLARYDAIVDLL